MKLSLITLTSTSDAISQCLALTCFQDSQGMELERRFHKLKDFTRNETCQGCWKVTVLIDLSQLVKGKNTACAAAGQRSWPSGN